MTALISLFDLVGCDGGSSDDGLDIEWAPDIDVALPEPPEPWGNTDGLAISNPCPDGWHEVPTTSEGEVATCDPWPETDTEVFIPH